MNQTLAQPEIVAYPANSPKTRPQHSNAIQQAVVIQRIVFAKVKEEGLKAAELAGLARAWCDVNEEKRKLAMRPLPRSVDVSKLGRHKRQASVPAVEPAEPSPAT